jgi:hypothetical protein
MAREKSKRIVFARARVPRRDTGTEALVVGLKVL